MLRLRRFLALGLMLGLLPGCPFLWGDRFVPSHPSGRLVVRDAALTVKSEQGAVSGPWDVLAKDKANPPDTGCDVRFAHADWLDQKTYLDFTIRNTSEGTLLVDLKESTFLLQKRGRPQYGGGHRPRLGAKGKPAQLEEGGTLEPFWEKEPESSGLIEVLPLKTVTVYFYYACNYVGKAEHELVLHRKTPKCSYYYRFQLEAAKPSR